MSEREQAVKIINEIPESKLIFIVNMLNSVKGLLEEETELDETPNAETIAAFEEGDKMLAEGTGQRYTSTKALFADLEG